MIEDDQIRSTFIGSFGESEIDAATDVAGTFKIGRP